VAALRKLLAQQEIPFFENETHITPIPIGDEKRCKRISDLLLYEHGIYIQPIVYPTVKKGKLVCGLQYLSSMKNCIYNYWLMHSISYYKPLPIY